MLCNCSIKCNNIKMYGMLTVNNLEFDKINTCHKTIVN